MRVSTDAVVGDINLDIPKRVTMNRIKNNSLKNGNGLSNRMPVIGIS